MNGGRDWRLEFIGPTGFGREYLLKLADYYGLSSERVAVVTPHTDEVFATIGRNDVLLLQQKCARMIIRFHQLELLPPTSLNFSKCPNP
jgi:hypothetical protein